MKKTIFIITAISLLLISMSACSQSRKITGTITDNNGDELPGVSIVIKNTSRGVISDINGKYSIDVFPSDSVLVFSFVGMETKEISFGTATEVNVVLKEAHSSLEEVIVLDDVSPDVEATAYTVSRPKSSKNISGYAVMEAEVSSSSYYYVTDHDFNTESYSAVRETGYKDVLHNPLSTFSIDVDNAAYSNIRRFINSGQLPPVDAVRIEEMLNYFTYNYAEPVDEHPFSVHTELSECPWNSKSQLLHVGLQGKNIDKTELPNSNLVFLIDVSGSMSSANRLPLAKTAMKMLLDELRPQDRVSIVVYSGNTQVLLESTPASNKTKIADAISSLGAGGYTAGGQALRMAYEVAEKSFIKGGNNRIVMCTDGDFNVGESSNAAMERLVEEKRKNGVFISVLGFGMGNYKDDRLEIIANKGNGNYGYIDNIQEARKILVSEFAGTLYTIAKDVKLQIEFNPERVKAYRLIGYENRRLNDEDFNDDKKDAGEMGSGHSVTALYEIIPAGSDMTVPGVDPLKYQNTPQQQSIDDSAELLTIKARYKKPDEDTSIKFEHAITGNALNFSKTTENFRFAASVAEFGLLIRDSQYKGNASFDNIIKTALKAKGQDEDGYRAEFINLVRTAKNLTGLSVEKVKIFQD
ncbi:MAG: von Willebrand factor type A domain-containing protein [Bacteroidales bacterium]